MTDARRSGGLWLLCAAQFMTVLDLTVVNGVLEPIRSDLHGSSASVEWVIGLYAIGFGGFLLAGGRTADVLGPRRTFAAGSLAFAVASLACAAAPTSGLLIAARGLQGVSAAFLEPAAMALLAALHPPGPDRARAFAVWASVGGLGAVSGMVVGGLATELVDWRAVFLLNVPIGLLGLALASRLLPEGSRRRGTPVDLVGAIFLTAGTAGLGLLIGTMSEGVSTASCAGALLAAIGIGGFARRQTRARAPLVPRGFLRRSGIALPAATGSIQGAVMLGSLFLLAATLMTLMGLGPIEAGVAMLGLRLTQSGWARKAAGIVEGIGARHAHLLGLGGMAVGCASFLRLGSSPDYVTDVLPGLVVLGLSAPFVFVTGSILTHQCTPPSESGLAAGILGSCQWLGGSLGVAVVSACLAAYGDGVATGIRAGFGVCAALAAAAMVTAGLAMRKRPSACRIA